MKINVSYTQEEEAQANTVQELLKPILDRFKVKKSAGTPPYKHLYFTPRNEKKQ